MKYFYFFSLIVWLTGCFQTTEAPPSRVHSATQEKTQPTQPKSENGEQNQENQETIDSRTPYEKIEESLETIELQIEREPFTTQTDFWPSFQYSLNHTEGFVEILRCHGNYEVKLLTGESVFVEQQSKADKAFHSFELEGAWKQALDDEKSCSLISQGTGILTVQDVAATDGTFYYILNPCVPDFSLQDGQRCSYRMVRTAYVVDFENRVTSELQDMSRRLAEAETLLNERFGRLKVEARKVIRALEACENVQTHEMAQKSFLTGLTQLAATATGAVIGGVLGGPQGAVIAGQLLGTVGSFVGSIAFPQGQDECSIQARDDWARFEILWKGDDQSPGVEDMIKEASEIQGNLNLAYCQYRSKNAEILVGDATQDHYKCGLSAGSQEDGVISDPDLSEDENANDRGNESETEEGANQTPSNNEG